LDQSDNARLEGIFNLLGGLASVKAQVDVNTGIKELSPDIAKLPTQYQNMFANLSFNAKSQQDVARAYAYVQRLAANAGQTPS
jgi:hypothetical protein